MENRIGSERVRIGMSQKALAKRLGLSNKTISAWETGLRKPNPKYLIALANHFQCSTDYLLGLNNERVPAQTASKTSTT